MLALDRRVGRGREVDRPGDLGDYDLEHAQGADPHEGPRHRPHRHRLIAGQSPSVRQLRGGKGPAESIDSPRPGLDLATALKT